MIIYLMDIGSNIINLVLFSIKYSRKLHVYIQLYVVMIDMYLSAYVLHE